MTPHLAELRVLRVFDPKTAEVPSSSSFGMTGDRLETRSSVSVFCGPRFVAEQLDPDVTETSSILPAI